jgi:hypothetical protein
MENKDEYNAYFRKYREKKGDHLRNMEKVKYYKKKGLDEDFIKTYGELSGDVYKLSVMIETLHKKAPTLCFENIVKQSLSRGGPEMV